MKRKKKVTRALALMLISCFFLLSMASAAPAENADILNEGENLMLLQRDAILAHEVLLDEFFSSVTENEDLPVWYGGAYIDDSNILVIRLVEGYETMQGSITAVMPEDAAYRFETTDISLRDLYQQYRNTSNLLRENNIRLPSVSLTQKTSTITLSLPKDNSITMETVLSALNTANTRSVNVPSNNHLAFDSCEYPTTTASLIGGNPIYTNSGEAGSIGFCCSYKINGVLYYGVLTAGHVLTKSNYASLYFGGIGVGSSGNTSYNSVVQFADWEKGDFALIPKGSANSSTNLVNATPTSTGAITIADTSSNIAGILEGKYVNKYGKTTQLTYGQIEKLDSVFYAAGPETIDELIYVNNLSYSSTNPICASGDSGGPVWYINSSGQRVLLGVISGSNTTTGQTLYFSPLYHIRNDFAIYPGI